MKPATALRPSFAPAGVLSALVALVVLAGSPVLGLYHLDCLDGCCTPLPPSAEAHGPGDHHDAERNGDSEHHDPLTCQICHVVFAAHTLLASQPVLDWTLDDPPDFLVRNAITPRRGWDVATSFPARSPPADPSLTRV